MRHSVLQGIWWDRSLDSWMFIGIDFMISILVSSHISREALNPSWWYQILMTKKKPFVKWMLHGIELLLHQNLIYWLSPTAALEQSLRAVWDAASQAAVLILPQIKLNSQLSSCTSFFSGHHLWNRDRALDKEEEEEIKWLNCIIWRHTLRKIWMQGGVCEGRESQIRLTRFDRLDKV